MWETVKLGDIVAYEKMNGQGSNLPYLGMEHISSETMKLVGSLEIPEKTSSTFKFDERHVLFGRLRPYLRKVFVPDFDGQCSTEIFCFLPSDKVDKRFLAHWLLNPKVSTRINETCTGARMPRANMNAILDFEFPLPPLAEQQRIVAKLDAAFAEIDTAIEVAEAKEAEVEKLKSSLLSDLLSGETLLSGLTPITELCEAIYAGGDAPPKEKISKVETDEFSVPIYSNGAKGAGLYGFTSFEPRTLKPAITISARGTIGHIEMRTRPFLPIVRLIVLEPKTAKVNLTFLKYALLNTEVFGSGSSIPQLTVPMLKKMNIVSPPLAEQQRIVAKLEAAFAEIDNAKQAIQRAKENHAALKSAILAQELTPPTESEAA